MNEIETRRVRNALARLADAAPALTPDELAAVAARARWTPLTDRRRKPWLAAAAAAAVAVAAGGASVVVRDSGDRGETTAGATVVSFPEGSAVYLLTAHTERRPR